MAHSRRLFLLGLSSVLAGCALFPARLRVEESALGEFLELSGALTGFPPHELDPAAARAIMAAFAGYPSCSLERLLHQPPGALDEGARQLTGDLVRAWYTGLAPGPEGPVRLAMSPLQWRALGLAAGPGHCHGPWWHAP